VAFLWLCGENVEKMWSKVSEVNSHAIGHGWAPGPNFATRGSNMAWLAKCHPLFSPLVYHWFPDQWMILGSGPRLTKPSIFLVLESWDEKRMHPLLNTKLIPGVFHQTCYRPQTLHPVEIHIWNPQKKLEALSSGKYSVK
jgi:hypothetical protein